MAKFARLDVLIVYNGNITRSALEPEFATPFDDESYSEAYAYFLTTCKSHNIRAGLSSSSDIIGAGSCKSYWTYNGHAWQKIATACKSRQIFDKFSPKDESTLALRQLLFSSSHIRSFNSYSLFKLFFDKQKTHDALTSFTIPTLTLTSNSLRSIQNSCDRLADIVESHPRSQDFSDSVILKDKFGAGGKNIYKFKFSDYAGIRTAVVGHPLMTFIIQPLVKFDRGFKYLGKFVSTDIRLIYLSGKIVSSYIRIAKTGDFRCNQHQGGSLVYLPQSAIPKVVMQQSKKIASILNKQSSLFTLDFLRSNSGQAYLLEGNTGPGLNWDQSDQVDQIETKKLIRLIVKEIISRVTASKPKSPRPSRRNHPAKSPFLPLASETLSLALAP